MTGIGNIFAVAERRADFDVSRRVSARESCGQTIHEGVEEEGNKEQTRALHLSRCE